MCAQYGGGVPLFRNVLVRERLLGQLARSSAHAILVVGASGCGKTVLASQLAGRHPGSRWFSCNGEVPDADLVSGEVAILLGLCGEGVAAIEPTGFDLLDLASRACGAGLEPDSRYLVVDDADLTADPRTPDRLWLVAQVLAQRGVQLVVTTRELPSDCALLHRYRVVDQDELALSLAEAIELAEGVGLSRSSRADVESIWQQTEGHAAFFALMLRAYLNDGYLSVRNRELSTWIRHVIDSQLTDVDRVALAVGALLKSGRTADILRVAGETAECSLVRLSDSLPLFRMQTKSAGSGGRFAVHDILCDYIQEALRLDLVLSDSQLDQVVEVLVERADYARAAAVADLGSTQGVVGFLLQHGFQCVIENCSAQVSGLLRRAPIAEVMGHPDLLLLWSDALLDCSELEESLAKARAARVLAEHLGQQRVAAQALANAIDALRLMNRWDEASELVREARVLLAEQDLESEARAPLSRALGALLALSGDYEEYERHLREAIRLYGSTGARGLSDVREAEESLALVPCLAQGDYAAMAQGMAKWAALDEGRLAQRVDSKGNLATALLELGRLDRASELLRDVIAMAGESSLIYYLPVLGCLEFARFEEALGLDTIGEAVRRGLAARADAEVAQNRVYEAMLLRAAGRLDGALASAEKAYERLAVQDFIDFRRLAALEVAASLLSLGDKSAARAWTEALVTAGFGQNSHHAFRAALILAECDIREGQPDAAVERLRPFREHVKSGNSNFQAAMYVRAFPDLLGVLTAAVGAADVPVHLLRMISPELGEKSLQLARDVLSQAEWELLGERILGPSQFRAFVERKGRPLCRVRMFGGLEITIGDRVVRDRDWKKRKARMLFSMLVLRRGQEISREQLLEHVWPELSADRAKNNFYVAWSAMKSALMGEDGKNNPLPYVENTGGRCRIVPEALRSDIDQFEEYLAAARDAEAAGDSEAAVEAYERLAATYRGELLPGDPYEDWFGPIRERYRYEFIAAMLRLTDILLELDDPCEALIYARRALEVDLTREDLYQATLRCQIAAGQRSAAIETFVQCKTQLAEELGLDPSAETVALYQQILVMEERPRYDDFGLT